MLTRSLGTRDETGGNCLPQSSQPVCRLGLVARSFSKETEWGHRAPHPSLLYPLPGLFPLVLCSPLLSVSCVSTCLSLASSPPRGLFLGWGQGMGPEVAHVSCSPETWEPGPMLGGSVGR